MTVFYTGKVHLYSFTALDYAYAKWFVSMIQKKGREAWIETPNVTALAA